MNDSYDPRYKGSELRLWQLIAERRKAADKQAIDERIWDLFGEDWAVMFTDLVGFSRQVERFGIMHFLQVIHEQKELLLPIIDRHDGILIKVEADSFLVIFKRVRKALACAVAMQRACAERNQGRADEDKVLLCVGIGAGRILRIGDHDVFGAEVNAASKLGEDTAKAWEVWLTREARERAGDVPGLVLEETDVRVPGSPKCYRARYDGA